MRISVERLRNWLLVGAVLLVLVIAGFLGYARYKAHRFIEGLPSKLGIDIRRETNGYTYSQSVKGKTVMTLHAAKAVEHMDGKLTLHDVRMVLYGRKQDRADRISGNEFEYEQSTGVVRAVGEVHIDLEAPTPIGAQKKPAVDTKEKQDHIVSTVDDPSEEGSRVIHVKTSGLVYLQKLGVAATDQDVEFVFHGITGHAMGAEYNSDTGVLILQAAVKANGLQHERPVVLTATHAEIDRQQNFTVLTDAKYVSPGQTALADHAVVHQRSDGSPERIDAEGHVRLIGSNAGTISAPHGDVLMNAAGKAQNAHMFGGVNYEDVDLSREGKGKAEDARLAFDAAGRPENVVLVGGVHVVERVRALVAGQVPANAPWSLREATAGRMTFAFKDDSTGKHKELKEAEAMSAAHVTIVNDAGTAMQTKSEIAGDELTGHFIRVGKVEQLSDLHGVGNTVLHRVGLNGLEQTSTGAKLDATLRPSTKRSVAQDHTAGRMGGEEVAKAVQSGHVVLTSIPARKTGDVKQQTPVKATAELAVYDGDADHLTLTGQAQAQVLDAGSTVWANKIVMEHESGDATAEGLVKANYVQPNSTEPVHVLADHAELKHASNRALFYGVTGKPARMWQGASQVEAPVLDMEQQQKKLTARGGDGGSGGALPVHAVLVNAGKGSAETKDGHAGGANRTSVVRVASRTMVYLDGARQVDFDGDVKVEDTNGVMRAHQATAYLKPAPSVSAPAGGNPASKQVQAKDSNKAASGVFFGGSVERIVATGAIEMEQPGRRAMGEKLVYTASDSMFVLTGTNAAPPKLIDEVQGTVTGSALRFHTGDDSVVVIGGSADNPGQRVHTVTRVKQK